MKKQNKLKFKKFFWLIISLVLFLTISSFIGMIVSIITFNSMEFTMLFAGILIGITFTAIIFAIFIPSYLFGKVLSSNKNNSQEHKEK
ncbi:MAG: hypothetical protein IJK72_01405 [Mycoplasma sp.]|nr:hypothetical protein [Mycoplasma sp.]